MRGIDRSEKRTEGVITRPLILLAVTIFIDLLGFGIVLPNMPQYIERAVGTNHQHAGLIGGLLAASYSFTQFICAPLWGRWSDKVGRRPVILISLVGIGIAYILFGLADGRLWMLFAARLLAGVLSSASIGVAFAYVADITSPENRARGIGILGACFGLGFMCGPAVGGILGQKNIALPAFVAAGMALANFLFSIRFLPESLSVERRGERADAFSVVLLGQAMAGPAGLLFLLTFLITFGFSALEQNFSFYLLAVKELGVTPKNQPLVSGGILGLAGLAGVIIQGGLIGRLVARYGEATIAKIGLACMTVGFALFPFPRSVYLLAFGPLLLLSCGRAMTAPALSSILSRRTPLGQGLTLSTSQSFDALARTIGPVTAGLLFNKVGVAAPYVTAAVVMALALCLTFTMLFSDALSVRESRMVG